MKIRLVLLCPFFLILLDSCSAGKQGSGQAPAEHTKMKKAKTGNLHLASGKRQKPKRREEGRSSPSDARGGNKFQRNLVDINMLPAESLRVDYNLALSRIFSMGCDFSVFYPTLLMLTAEKRTSTGNTNAYSDDYFRLSKPYYVINPYLKTYLYHDPKEPLAGVYLKFMYSATTLIDGLKSCYYNQQGIPRDTGVATFQKMAPGNKVLEQTSSFTTWGFSIIFGGTTKSVGRHLVFDFGIGYQYLHLPSDIQQNRVSDQVTYYYHDTPMWKNPVNSPYLVQLSIGYRF